MLLRDCKVIHCKWVDEHENLATIRRRVFIEEQSVPEKLEWDGEDLNAIHFLIYEPSGNAIGCARLLPNGHIGRMAILKAFRAKGLGSHLLSYLIAYAQEHGFHRLFLNAQIHAIHFYKKFGFNCEGNEFDDAGIPHIKMFADPIPRILCLGLSHEKVVLQHNHDYPVLLHQMALQAQFRVCIFSYQLNHELFGEQRFADALSEMARGFPRSRVDILIRESRDLAKQNHPLVTLSHLLPDKVSIRLLTRRPEAHYEEYLLADKCGLMLKNNYKEDIGYICFNSPSSTENLLEQFDDMWQRSYPDQRLRQI